VPGRSERVPVDLLNLNLSENPRRFSMRHSALWAFVLCAALEVDWRAAVRLGFSF